MENEHRRSTLKCDFSFRPPVIPNVVRFTLADWSAKSQTLVQPTLNHQHLLVAGKTGAPGYIAMYHVPSALPIRSFTGETTCILALNNSTFLSGHTARITCMLLSTNGHIFYSTSLDKTARCWDLNTGVCIRNISPHTAAVNCAVVTTNDSYLVRHTFDGKRKKKNAPQITGSQDCSAKMIDASNGRVVYTFSEQNGSVTSLALTSDDCFLVCLKSRSLNITTSHRSSALPTSTSALSTSSASSRLPSLAVSWRRSTAWC